MAEDTDRTPISPQGDPGVNGSETVAVDGASPGVQRGVAGVRRQSVQQDAEARNNKPYTKPERQPWTLTHGFYAVMGGFVVETADSDWKKLRSWYGPRLLTLTPLGVSHLLKKGIAPPSLPQNVKEDKSKANGLAKFLVCVHAL